MDLILFEAAKAARKNAYVPYSHFAVGAAVRAKDGRVFTGCNIENAIFAAVKEGVRDFETLLVTADTEGPVSPCGACRQVMAEFGISHIELTNLKGLSQCVSLEELLPYGFTLKEKE